MKLKTFIYLLSFFIIGVNQVKGQQNYTVISNWLQFTDAHNFLYRSMANQAFSLLRKRDSSISKIYSTDEWRQRQERVKKTLLAIIGPFPQRTPLDAKIVKKIKVDGFTVENIIFQSQPGFYVTSSLFIPSHLKGKAPAILYCSGHTPVSYRDPAYQQVIINLVEKGFIVFAYDPIGQGERNQYAGPQPDSFSLIQASDQHAYAGVQTFIAGSSLAKYMIWDGIRAIDYLFTRKDVDTSRIGITGQSGGGTQCAYIAALDSRIYAEAPSSYITNFTRLLQSIGPQDAEQNLFHEIINGIDQPDLLEVRAPKPALMLTTTRDFFPIQGSIEAAKEISRIYRAYGKGNYFRMSEDDAPHQWTKKNREAMYAFFQKYLKNPGDSTDLNVPLLPDSDLQVTKTGQVSTSFPHSKTVFDLNREDVQQEISMLNSRRKGFPDYIPKMIDNARALSGYHDPDIYHQPVFTGRYEEDGYKIEKYFVQGDGDYVIPYLLAVPDKPTGKAVICLNPLGKIREMDNGDLKWFVRNGFTVLIPDLLGVGEIGHGYKNLRQSTLRWFLSVLIGRSVVGIRAGDIVRLANLLKERKNISEVYGLARGTLCSSMLYAAGFDTGIERVCLVGPCSSYRSIAVGHFYDPRFIYGAVAGSLKEYDLPDLLASLAPRKLMMINIRDGAGKPIEKNSHDEDITFIRDSYHYRKADRCLKVVYGEPTNNLDHFFNEWIQ